MYRCADRPGRLLASGLCGGEVVISYVEMQDRDALDTALATSQQPFDLWYPQNLYEFHGLDVLQIRRRRLDPVFVWPDEK